MTGVEATEKNPSSSCQTPNPRSGGTPARKGEQVGFSSAEKREAGLFPMAAVTNNHKIDGTITTNLDKYLNLLSYSSEAQTSEMGFTGVLRCQQNCVPSRGPRSVPGSLPFPFSRDCLHFLACGPFFHLQNQQWLVESSSRCIPLTLTLPLPSSAYKDLCS